MKEAPLIVSQLRYEEEHGQLTSKNIYKNISEDESEFASDLQKTKNHQHLNIIKNILENQKNPAFIQDGNYKTEWINHQTQQTFTLPNKSIQNTSCYTLIFNKSSPCSFCPMKKAIENNKPITTQIKDKQTNINKITSIPFYKNKQLIGIIQQIHMNTLNNPEIKYNPDKLQTQTIIDNAALGIVVLDKHLNHLTVNPAFSGMTGFENTDLKNQNTNPVYWPTKFSQQIKTEIQRLQQKGHLKMETYFQRKDNSIFFFFIVGSTFIDEQTKKEHIILIIEDITKTKATERELKISQLLLLSLIQNLEKKVKERTQKIEQLLKQKNEFINQLGHDLKNPLGPLINLTPILLKNETDPRKKRMLTVINRNTTHMKNLITKTIELAQLNSGNIHLHFQKINLTNACNESIIRNNHLLQKNNIQVINKLPQCLPVHADQIRIEELFDNILTNAIKYSPDGGTITITGSSTETTVTISIKDTGIGMNKQQLSHVFDEFYKADPARHDFKSSGLGASIIKRIVEKHGGHIKIESKGMGKGTTVTFTILKSPSNKPEQKNKSNQGDR